ncbi:hypothetical protein HD806DRAFT_536538 [Xylariaceae sp. AK1471]|nr:hypothetical protein HD806DRAFT_536538 [Xylariaceae sp. AK1471]
MQALAKLTTFLGLFAVAANAAFVLVNPPPMPGSSQITPPCGGAAVAEDTNFTEWPTAGLDVVTTNVTENFGPTFTINVALLEDDSNFVPWYLSQSGPNGKLCISRVQPWRIQDWDEEEWLGQTAIFQMVEYVGNGVQNYAEALLRISALVEANNWPRLQLIKATIHEERAA